MEQGLEAHGFSRGRMSRGVDVMSLPQLLRALWKTGATKKKDAAKLAEGEPRMDI